VSRIVIPEVGTFRNREVHRLSTQIFFVPHYNYSTKMQAPQFHLHHQNCLFISPQNHSGVISSFPALCLLIKLITFFNRYNGGWAPPLRSSGQSFWLQIQRSRVRFSALPDFLRSRGSGTVSTQPREDNLGAT
jgi:hypothetical protein